MLTDKNREYWGSKEEENSRFVISLFSRLTGEEVRTLYGLLSKVQEVVDEKYSRVRDQ